MVAGAHRCRHKQVPTGCAQDESDKKCGKWECSTQCKPLTVFEVDASHCFFKASFGLPAEKVRQALAEWDMGCPFSILVGSSPVDLRGHPIACYNGELCTKVYLTSLGPSKFGHNSFIFHPISK